jgi:thiol peroxidase
MAKITLKGNLIHTNGELPKMGTIAPDFALVTKELATVSLEKFKGKRVVLNIFPSLDTPVCSMSVRKFNELAEQMENTVILCISRDLPFAQARFCGAEGLEKVITLSEFRNDDFSTKYGVKIADGPMLGLMARAVVILDEKLEVIYTELVPEIAQEPDYEKALQSLK